MNRWILISGALGAAWMALIISLQLRSLYVMAYPGLWVVENYWPSYRGIAPSALWIFTAESAVVIVSAIEWIIAGLVLRKIIRRISN